MGQDDLLGVRCAPHEASRGGVRKRAYASAAPESEVSPSEDPPLAVIVAQPEAAGRDAGLVFEACFGFGLLFHEALLLEEPERRGCIERQQ